MREQRPYPDEDLLCAYPALHGREATLHIVPAGGDAARVERVASEPAAQVAQATQSLRLRRVTSALLASGATVHATRMPRGRTPEGLAHEDELWWLHYGAGEAEERARRHFETMLAPHGVRRAGEEEARAMRGALECKDGFTATLQGVIPAQGAMSGRARRRAMSAACAALCAGEGVSAMIVRCAGPARSGKGTQDTLECALWAAPVGDGPGERKRARSEVEARLKGTGCALQRGPETWLGRVGARLNRNQGERVPSAAEAGVLIAPWQAVYARGNDGNRDP